MAFSSLALMSKAKRYIGEPLLEKEGYITSKEK